MVFFRQTIVLLCWFGIFAAPVLAQDNTTKITIRSADQGRGIRTDSTEIQVLVGNVSFEQKGTVLNCDSALLFEAFNRVLAYGHVNIVQGDTLSIKSQSLRYEGNQNKATLTGDVRLRHHQMQLTTSRLTYYLNDKKATYLQGATIYNDSTTLSSIIGTYYSTRKTAFFKQNVRLVHPRYTLTSDTLEYHTPTKIAYFHGPTTIVSDSNTIYCESGWYDTKHEIARFIQSVQLHNPPQLLSADTIYYNRNKGYGRALQDIVFRDTAQAIILLSDAAEYFEHRKTVHATQSPTVIHIINKDSLFIRADTLLSIQDSQRNVLLAFPDVAILKSDLQGVCDSLVYNRNDSILHLYQSPVMWSDSNQFTADTIRIFYAATGIDYVKLYDQAFMAAYNDTLIYDQVKGRTITGNFYRDTLRSLLVDGNGESVYYARDDSNAYIGANKVQSSTIRIRLKNNTVDKISFVQNPEARLEPMQSISPGNFILEGFAWKGHLRPQRKRFKPYPGSTSPHRVP